MVTTDSPLQPSRTLVDIVYVPRGAKKRLDSAPGPNGTGNGSTPLPVVGPPLGNRLMGIVMDARINTRPVRAHTTEYYIGTTYLQIESRILREGEGRGARSFAKLP